MAIVNKIDALLERAYTEGDRLLNEAYGELLKPRAHWGEICTVMPTNRERVDLSMLLDVPEYAEEIGGVAFSDLVADNYIITPRRFSAGVKMHEDDIDDDGMGIVVDRIMDLAQTPEDAFCKHTFLALQAGIAVGAYGACYDGGAFFAAHTNGDNYDAGGGATPWYLLDCSARAKPLIMAARKSPVFSQEKSDSSHRFETGEIRWKIQGRMWMGYGLWQRAYCSETALTDDELFTGQETMRGFTDEAGRYLSTGPTHLVVAPDTYQTAVEILSRYQVSDGTTSVSNEPVKGLNLKLIVDPYLIP